MEDALFINTNDRMDYNHAYKAYPKEKKLHQFFEEQVLKTPVNIAVEDEIEGITYQELNAKANQLARLLQKIGVVNEDIVAIMLERSINMIISILAVLKTGAAYLPVNIDYPKDRIKFILTDSKAKLLIYSDSTNNADYSTKTLKLDSIPLNQDTSNLNLDYSSSNLACVLYTSGSSGVPKGVMLNHDSFVNNLLWSVDEYGISANDNILNKSICNFDASTWEIFISLITGAKLCLYRQGQEKNVDYLIKTIENKQISVCFFVPSMLSAFLDYIEHKKYIDKVNTLKIVFSGGEVLSYLLTEKFNKLIHKKYLTKLFNWYGPTETTVYSTFFDCTGYQNEDRIIPIGRPVANTAVYILDENKNRCKTGEIGEIYISGDGVGRGYVHNDELTRERFIPDAFKDGYRMYRTGDLGRWSNDYIEYYGRIDNQIKIRGNRVELEEIENVILQYGSITQTIISVIENDGGKILIAFYKSNGNLSEDEIEQHLRAKLPDYMIPAIYIQIDSFPQTHSGKIDRNATLEAYLSKVISIARPYADSQGEISIEEGIVNIIKYYVDAKISPSITLDSTLPNLAVDSITFIQIVVALEEAFDFEFDDEMLDYNVFQSVGEIIKYVSSKLTY